MTPSIGYHRPCSLGCHVMVTRFRFDFSIFRFFGFSVFRLFSGGLQLQIIGLDWGGDEA